MAERRATALLIGGPAAGKKLVVSALSSLKEQKYKLASWGFAPDGEIMVLYVYSDPPHFLSSEEETLLLTWVACPRCGLWHWIGVPHEMHAEDVHLAIWGAFRGRHWSIRIPHVKEDALVGEKDPAAFLREVTKCAMNATWS